MLLNITEYVIFWRVCKISGLKFLCSHKCENRNWLQRGFHESEYRLRLYFCSLEKKKKTSAKKVYFYGHGFYLLLITTIIVLYFQYWPHSLCSLSKESKQYVTPNEASETNLIKTTEC